MRRVSALSCSLPDGGRSLFTSRPPIFQEASGRRLRMKMHLPVSCSISTVARGVAVKARMLRQNVPLPATSISAKLDLSRFQCRREAGGCPEYPDIPEYPTEVRSANRNEGSRGQGSGGTGPKAAARARRMFCSRPLQRAPLPDSL
jgi:hypothetical protein